MSQIIKVTVDYGWSGCTDEVELEMDEDATDAEIEDAAWDAGRQAANERLDIEWKRETPI